MDLVKSGSHHPAPYRRAIESFLLRLPRSRGLSLVLLALLVVCSNTVLASSGSSDELSDKVHTGSGPVVGEIYPTSRAFLAIPYANAPVGELRWAEPEPVTPWTLPRYAGEDVERPLCPSVDNKGFVEDCLVLNIWTPHTAVDSPKPVMFWIHGGGFQRGTSSSPAVDGKNLAEMYDVVVVTINYRLGPLGFFSHPDLAPSSGNQGFLDQQLALNWVKDNIARFGGDPNTVTLFGESAGSISICLHLVAPDSEGLFHRAIMQSGACSEFLPDGLSSQSTHEEAEQRGLELAEVLGCGNSEKAIECLRETELNEIVDALPVKPGYIIKGQGFNWFPNIDGTILPDLAYDLVRRGEFHRVPLLVGTNRDEGGIFVALAIKDDSMGVFFSKRHYTRRIERRFGDLAPRVLEYYPYRHFPFSFSSFSDMVGDMFYVCPTRRTIRAIQSHGVPTFLYQFSVVRRNLWGLLGAYHASEIPFVFHTASGLSGFTRAERSTSREMMRYWTNFARTGDPNGSESSIWRAYEEGTDSHLDIGHHIETGSGLKDDVCDFWDLLQSEYPDPINVFHE